MLIVPHYSTDLRVAVMQEIMQQQRQSDIMWTMLVSKPFLRNTEKNITFGLLMHRAPWKNRFFWAKITPLRGPGSCPLMSTRPHWRYGLNQLMVFNVRSLTFTIVYSEDFDINEVAFYFSFFYQFFFFYHKKRPINKLTPKIHQPSYPCNRHFPLSGSFTELDTREALKQQKNKIVPSNDQTRTLERPIGQ